MKKIFNKKSIGKYGEDLAADYLKEKRYRILVRNYRCPSAEVDIIAIKKRTLCFVEVKARQNNSFGSVWESIPPMKQRRIIQAARHFLLTLEDDKYDLRFDVIVITADFDGTFRVEHLPDAFRCN